MSRFDYVPKFAQDFKRHLGEAMNYYEELSPGLGGKFEEEVKTHVASVCQFPYACAVRYSDVRFAVVKRFHFAIHYVVYEERKEVNFFAIHSMYRDPDKHWQKPDDLFQ